MRRGIFKIHLPCSSCQNDMTIVEIGGNAIGLLFVTCICILCNRESTMRVNMQYVAERAARSDKDAEKKDHLLEQLNEYEEGRNN